MPLNRCDLPAAVNVLRWVGWETFRQASASRLGAVLLTVTVIAVIFCAGVRVRGGRLERGPTELIEFVPRGLELNAEQRQRAGVVFIEGETTLAYGLIRVPHARTAEDSVHFVQLILAVAVAGTLGLLLTLVWTAGFLPTFLEPYQATIVLTKPVPRVWLLGGKYLGVTAYVGIQATVFVGATWLTLGLATGIWSALYWWAVPLLVLQFAVFFAFSVLLAVGSRSTVVCIVGSVSFWFFCSAVNSNHIQHVVSESPGESQASIGQIAYWILPKPLDLFWLLGRTLRADSYLSTWSALQAYGHRVDVSWEPAVFSSLIFAVLLFVVAWGLLRRVTI
jgi:ABC-type transport system involved in multi-copper enzyme maturation permease subunit